MMMFHEKFVTCVKVNGQVLRESAGTVTIPFGSEYTLLLKNLNSVRAQVKVDIDGDNVTDGWLIIAANTSFDLERSIRNGNLSKGNRFKFIERTEAIEQHRGVKEDDGLIRVEFKMEKVYEARKHYYDEWVPRPNPWPDRRRRRTDPWYPWTDRRNPPWCGGSGGPLRSSGIIGSSGLTASSFSNAVQSSLSKSTEFAEDSCFAETAAVNDAGITVAGSESNQQFVYTSGFETEHSDVIVLKLRGQVAGKKVHRPITVKTKIVCSSCGLKSGKGEQFCSKCGTALVTL